MAQDYVAFIASAYGMSFAALAGLGLWIFVDARRTRARLETLEAASGRRTQGERSQGERS